MEQLALQQLGLSAGEAEIYLILLAHGESIVSAVAKRTRIARPHVYDILAKLEEKGLVRHIKKNSKRYYAASSPLRLTELLKEKGELLAEVLPTLEKYSAQKKEQTETEVYSGIEGVKNVYIDILRTKPKEWCAFGGGRSLRYLGAFSRIWHKKRINEGIFLRGIIDTSIETYHAGKEAEKWKHTKIRYFPQQYMKTISIYIYANKVAFIIWYEINPLAIIITNKDIATFFTSHFMLAWNASNTVFNSRHKVNLYEFINKAQHSLDILDVVGTEILHEGREKIISLLKKRKRVRVLLADPLSPQFAKRVFLEEQYLHEIGESRMTFEWKAAMANLKDIDKRTKSKQLQIRLYSTTPESTTIILDRHTLLHNRYSKRPGDYGAAQPAEVLIKHFGAFEQISDAFEKKWRAAKSFVPGKFSQKYPAV